MSCRGRLAHRRGSTSIPFVAPPIAARVRGDGVMWRPRALRAGRATGGCVDGPVGCLGRLRRGARGDRGSADGQLSTRPVRVRHGGRRAAGPAGPSGRGHVRRPQRPRRGGRRGQTRRRAVDPRLRRPRQGALETYGRAVGCPVGDVDHRRHGLLLGSGQARLLRHQPRPSRIGPGRPGGTPGPHNRPSPDRRRAHRRTARPRGKRSDSPDLSYSFSGFGDPITIEPPPADRITTESGTTYCPPDGSRPPGMSFCVVDDGRSAGGG